MKEPEEKAFSFHDVKNILCELCNMGSDTHQSGNWYVHTINGSQVPCTASRWLKSKRVRSMVDVTTIREFDDRCTASAFPGFTIYKRAKPSSPA
jgi:hypothetical protein